MRHQLKVTGRGPFRWNNGKACPGYQPNNTLLLLRSNATESAREIGCQDHAAADRLTMQPRPEAQARLNRMAKSMAEIQNRPQA